MAKKRKPAKRTSRKTGRGRTTKQSASARGKPGEAQLVSLRRYIRTGGKAFLADPNITSIGIGYKIKGGEQTSELCLQFTVRSKPEESGTTLEALGTTPIPESIDVNGEEIATDVIQRDYRVSAIPAVSEQTDPRKVRVDPVMPGVSVSHPEGTAGTLGLIVYDRTNGAPCMLSNWHVLHTHEGEIGDPVVQPGPFDDNRVAENVAGLLVRSHLGEAGDCAIARIEDRNIDSEILDLDERPTKIERTMLGDTVIKSGRTTGVTRGVVRRVDVIARITYEGVGPMDIGGFEIGPEPGAPANLEISMGGDSGSAWLLTTAGGVVTDTLVGLHFAGEGQGNPDEHALACYAHSVFKKLNIQLEEVPENAIEAVGRGYDQDFLAERVPRPWLTDVQFADAVHVGSSPMLPYTHFSVCGSRTRRLARFVAWNIDGRRLKSLSRNGLEFFLDDRVDSDFQVDNALYRNNNLDRGHLARRADLTWGAMAEAQRANRDSFCYTNIVPQHQAFNQSSRGGLWGRLENLILEETNVRDLRVSVMAGPIFHDDDPVHRDIQIPRDFWKLLAYHDDDDDRFEVRAYVVTQRDLLHDIEVLDLDPFRLFQVSLDRLQEETGLTFPDLQDFDTHEDQGPEAIGRGSARELVTAEDVLR